MANRRGTLGRGLGALLGNQALTFINNQNKDVIEEIPISSIRHQSRKNYGTSIIAYDKNSRSAKAYLNLAKEVIERGK